MNRMLAETGSKESAYNFVKSLAYYSGSKMKKDYQRAANYFRDSIRCGNMKGHLYLGIQY